MFIHRGMNVKNKSMVSQMLLYKSFPTYEEAESFMGGKGKGGPSKIKIEDGGQKSDVTAYIDGSYDEKQTAI